MNAKQKRRREHRKRKADRKWAKFALKSKGASPMVKLLAHITLDSLNKTGKEQAEDAVKFNWFERTPTLPPAAKLP